MTSRKAPIIFIRIRSLLNHFCRFDASVKGLFIDSYSQRSYRRESNVFQESIGTTKFRSEKIRSIGEISAHVRRDHDRFTSTQCWLVMAASNAGPRLRRILTPAALFDIFGEIFTIKRGSSSNAYRPKIPISLPCDKIATFPCMLDAGAATVAEIRCFDAALDRSGHRRGRASAR